MHQSGPNAAAVAVVGLFMLGIYAVVILGTLAGMWGVFSKAGHPGWAALVPIYNIYILTQVAGKPWWWMLLCFVPCANVVILFMLFLAIAKAFGRDIGTALGLFFLGFIFWPILGFGDAQYQGA